MSVRLEQGQMELRADTDQALIVGPQTAYRYPPEWMQWWGATEVRTFDTPRSGSDGFTAGRDLLGKHSTTIVVQILADDLFDLETKIDAWKAAAAASNDVLVALRANPLGSTRVRYGRFRIPGEVLSRGRVTLGGFVANASALFEALDPRTYADDQIDQTTARAIPGSGFAVPFLVPFTLPAGQVGTVAVVNLGNTAARWTARLDGPLVNPQVAHLEYGRRLAFTANGGLTIDAGQWLTIDSQTRSALLQGLSERGTQLTLDSEWFDLGPGSNSLELDADSGSGTVTFSWRHAYLS